MLFVQACKAIHDWDPDFTFHVAGEVLDPRSELYLTHSLKRLGLEQAVVFHGKVAHADMPDWLGDKGFILSTSPWESAQQSVLEGIACGCIPLLHAWPGCEQVYDLPGATWLVPGELPRLIQQASEDAPELARRNRGAIEHLALPAILDRIDALVDRVVEATDGPSMACCMIVKGNDPRLEAALKSIEGAFDEIVCLVDARFGEHNVGVAESFGARAWAQVPEVYHGCIDFSAARNEVASRAQSDWKHVKTIPKHWNCCRYSITMIPQTGLSPNAR